MSGKGYNPAGEGEHIDDTTTRGSGDTADEDPFTDDDVTKILDAAWDDLMS